MYIKRDIEDEIEKVINRKEIIAIVGARQVGKTTTINHILEKIKDKKINRVSFDDISTKSLFEEDIDSFISLHIKKYDILFIDEIQYVKDSGKILKYVYDKENIKIIISGSSASELSIQSLKYLVGRVFVYTMHPFNFKEFIRATNPELLEIYNEGKYKKPIIKKLNKIKNEFCRYGGYPEVVIEKDESIKEKIIKNIYSTYILKEIKELLHLAENEKLTRLLNILALQTGNIINYTDLAQESGFSIPTLKKYLGILEQTFICKRLPPFFRNKKKELIKNPKIYFIDFGFRNACLNNFSEHRTDIGAISEQFVFSEFEKKETNLKYWQTKAKAEVDFIIEKNNEIIPLEVKTTLRNEKTTRGFMNFLEEYQPKKSYIASEELENEIVKEKHKIYFIPIVKINLII